MKVNVSMEVEAESITSALQSVLIAIDAECRDLEVLEISASPGYAVQTTTEVVHNSVTNVRNCSHGDADVHLEGEQVKTGARALPANLS